MGDPKNACLLNFTVPLLIWSLIFETSLIFKLQLDPRGTSHHISNVQRTQTSCPEHSDISPLKSNKFHHFQHFDINFCRSLGFQPHPHGWHPYVRVERCQCNSWELTPINQKPGGMGTNVLSISCNFVIPKAHKKKTPVNLRQWAGE